jgi:mRNA-degrading endonuclease RelE of RelBE toxin-antitoxin system
VNGRLEAAESKITAEDFGVHESTLRKSPKTGTVSTSQGRFMGTFSHKEGNFLIIAEIQTPDSVVLAFEYAGRNSTDDRFNKEKSTPGKEWVIYYATDEICHPDCQKNAALEKLLAKMKLK